MVLVFKQIFISFLWILHSSPKPTFPRSKGFSAEDRLNYCFRRPTKLPEPVRYRKAANDCLGWLVGSISGNGRYITVRPMIPSFKKYSSHCRPTRVVSMHRSSVCVIGVPQRLLLKYFEPIHLQVFSAAKSCD